MVVFHSQLARETDTHAFFLVSTETRVQFRPNACARPHPLRAPLQARTHPFSGCGQARKTKTRKIDPIHRGDILLS